MHRRDFLRAGASVVALRGLARPLTAGAWAGSRAGQAAAPDLRFGDLSALVEEKMRAYSVPGAALGLFKAGAAGVRGFGVTSVDDPQPVTPETIFTIASVSKTITTTAMMALVDQGKVALDVPVQRYLPDFRVVDDEASRTVTLRHLLTHTPGWEGQLSTEDRGIEALAHFATVLMRDIPQLAPPGAVWGYNNAGFAIAGRVIEVVTGRNIHDALRQLVLTPAGLAKTFTRLPDAVTYPLSLGHRQQNGRAAVLRPFQSTSSITAGGVLTSITDLMRYARLHLGDAGPAGAAPWLARDSRLEMQTPQLTKNGTDDQMGVGWHLRRLGGVQTLAHGGTLNGHCLLIELVPSANLAFAILTNHTDGWRLLQDVERAVLQAHAGITLAPGQRIAHRGVNEAMTFHSAPLAPQPSPSALDSYTGTYRHPPNGTFDVRRADTGLIVATGAAQNGTPIVFYGRDVAYATAGNYVGSPYEFIRAADGTVRWIRVNGRIALKSA